MRTCQTAANEFLRQFWTATYPPAADQTLVVSSPAQRATKTAKMAAYLAKTHEKVGAIVAMAAQQGLDSYKIQTVCDFLVSNV